MSNKTLLATLTLGAAIALAGPAFAEKFTAKLDSKSEVPPNTSTATGTADIDYDAASKKLSWKLTYSGLSGPATAAHFHGPAEAGKNSGVAVAIPNATSSPVEGSATLTDAQAADLLAGKYYVNVHTAANPGGEIRGQVTK
ncbi:CHRD domain-containing protein [Bradyrhizobium pachyrhizi]|uniref:CHRD domain-containing protein n=1 Tax=Bradyrhizobium pachyrhizi TaxID=280333 RepID=A0A844SJ20_9BRAD|nr:CHRD domain-containing protein [Bradyrhizobium pachyrhizi]MVT65606.1 CHRD domain-containing protein [Bradyrhizobium pachyrhizi]WFU53700.1 CHRD domain-containing protein [Bradyrhizobium pachyrhizi]